MMAEMMDQLTRTLKQPLQINKYRHERHGRYEKKKKRNYCMEPVKA